MHNIQYYANVYLEYGESDDLLVVSHAADQYLELSKRPDRALTLDTVNNVFNKRIFRKGIWKQSRIVVLGCRTGKDGGIASEIAAASGAKVYATEGRALSVERTRFGSVPVIDEEGDNTVVHGVGFMRANVRKLRNLLKHSKK